MEMLRYNDVTNQINIMIDQWFNYNEIPAEFRMSVPFLLVFESEVDLDGDKAIRFLFFPLYPMYENFKKGVGNC
jgi:hypothetical protein